MKEKEEMQQREKKFFLSNPDNMESGHSITLRKINVNAARFNNIKLIIKQDTILRAPILTCTTIEKNS
jgi:hypothetical protein